MAAPNQEQKDDTIYLTPEQTVVIHLNRGHGNTHYTINNKLFSVYVAYYAGIEVYQFKAKFIY